jgi:ParB family chromosome partitioning protein
VTQPRKGPQRGLGRGLGALIPSQEPGSPGTPLPSQLSDDGVAVSVGDARYAEVPIEKVVPNPRQPRLVFDEEALAELAFSIQEIGLLQPIVVRPVGDHYELVAGERRLRACREAGLEHVPAIIRQTEDDAMLRDALLENLHRANLNALEEAAAYQQLLDDFGCTQDELAQRIGRSRPQVSNTIRLLRLPAAVQARVAAGVISAGHARALLGIQDPAAMEAMAGRIVREGLSVRAVEELVMLDQGGPGSSVRESKKGGSRGGKPRSQGMADVVGDISRRLSDVLDTRVTVVGMKSAKSNGRVVVEVADVEDLRRIADLIERHRG